MNAMNTATAHGEIERLERAFWQSMLDGRPEVATAMLTEPALMVSAHGVNTFDHAGYTRMARDDRFKLVDYEIADLQVTCPSDAAAVATYRVKQTVEMNGVPEQSEVFDSSTWVKVGGQWLCAMHTECAAAPRPS